MIYRMKPLGCDPTRIKGVFNELKDEGGAI